VISSYASQDGLSEDFSITDEHSVLTHHPSLSDGSVTRLLAEDNRVNQRLAVRLLEKCGHQVFVAEHGREAWRRWKNIVLTVVLMDVQMPEMDGFEATLRFGRRRKGRRPPSDTPWTALTMKGDRERCLASGMDGYVVKPIRPKELFSTIEDVMARSQSAELFRTPDATSTITGLNMTR